MRFWIIHVESWGTENIECPPWPLLLKDHRVPISLNETLFVRPWPIQNIWLCLSYCYINVASFIHSRITNSVKVVCFKAFVHKSNSNLCSTACWGGYAICCNIFTDRRIMNQVSGTLVCHFPQDYRIENEQIVLSSLVTVSKHIVSLFFEKAALPLHMWTQFVLCIKADTFLGVLPAIQTFSTSEYCSWC